MERKQRAKNPHSQTGGEPVDGPPQDRWDYNTRTLITHPSILCLCGSGAHHCEPKLSDGHCTSHVKRERPQSYTVCPAFAKWHLVPLCCPLIIIENMMHKLQSAAAIILPEPRRHLQVCFIHVDIKTLKKHIAVPTAVIIICWNDCWGWSQHEYFRCLLSNCT